MKKIVKKTVLICYGTRPEIIKLCPLIKELARRGIAYKTVFTGQHGDLYRDVSDLVPKPDFRFEAMGHNLSLSDTSKRIFNFLPPIIKRIDPALFIVQGDTTSAAMGAVVAHYEGVPVGHVEAGLRTYDLTQPYPEEFNRQLIARCALFHWAPTKSACENLRSEHVINYALTGNTIVDMCKEYGKECTYGDTVLITLHRRENFGASLRHLCEQLDSLADHHRDLRFIFPMHPNPNVQAMKPLLRHVCVIEPLSYVKFLAELATARCVITDSGGLQEECAAFKKKVLVCRKKTERLESVEAGFARLVGEDILSHFSWAADHPQWDGDNPYGDGNARIRIVDMIESLIK